MSAKLLPQAKKRFLGLLTMLVLLTPIAQAKDYQKLFQQFELENNYGKKVPLHEFSDRTVVVLAFLGTECPLAKLYGPKLDALQKRFQNAGVVILGVSSNKQDSLTELTAYANRYQISFPLFKDVGNRLADAVEATRTPEVFVFDKQRRLRYQGRIDDQYGVGYSREKATQEDLADAIQTILDGGNISEPHTTAVGCVIGRVKDLNPKGNITFTKDIAPILNNRCVECHREGEIGPFTLTSYEDVLGWEETILEVIEDNRMPPWSANPEFGHFANDSRLSQRERDTLRTWVENGMPEGDPEDLPPAPTFVEGWRIPEPDEIIPMRTSRKPFRVPAQGIVDYQRFLSEPMWDEDKYIYAAEARPQNRAVVHHILVYVIPPGARRQNLEKVLVGYAPGSVPIQYQNGLAIKIPAGSRLLFEMHYTPNGSPQLDMSDIGVCFMDSEDVQQEVEGMIVATKDFKIPPREKHYEISADRSVKKDQLLLSMTPHMHLRGKSFRYVAEFANGKKEVLLDVPKYDFNWQLKYILSEPKLLPRGTKIICTAVWDNSENNLVNPNPNVPVGWGDQSYDEMMIGFMDMVPAK